MRKKAYSSFMETMLNRANKTWGELLSATVFGILLQAVGEWRPGRREHIRDIGTRWFKHKKTAFTYPYKEKKFDDKTSAFLLRAICRAFLFLSPDKETLNQCQDICKKHKFEFMPGFVYLVVMDKENEGTSLCKISVLDVYSAYATEAHFAFYALYGLPMEFPLNEDNIKAFINKCLSVHGAYLIPFRVDASTTEAITNYYELRRKVPHENVEVMRSNIEKQLKVQDKSMNQKNINFSIVAEFNTCWERFAKALPSDIVAQIEILFSDVDTPTNTLILEDLPELPPHRNTNELKKEDFMEWLLWGRPVKGLPSVKPFYSGPYRKRKPHWSSSE